MPVTWSGPLSAEDETLRLEHETYIQISSFGLNKSFYGLQTPPSVNQQLGVAHGGQPAWGAILCICYVTVFIPHVTA